MKNILKTNLEIVVRTYDTEEEMEKDILEMNKEGFKVIKKGSCNLSSDSTLISYCDVNNWKIYAEFSRRFSAVTEEQGIYYETDKYTSYVYNPYPNWEVKYKDSKGNIQSMSYLGQAKDKEAALIKFEKMFLTDKKKIDINSIEDIISCEIIEEPEED